MTRSITRKATTEDVPAIQRLVNGYADRDLMLPRSLSQLYENVRDFHVVEERGEVVACGALHVSWKDLAELKSLAVAEHHQKKGFARSIVAACISEARSLGVARVFALTYVPEMFERLGFSRIEKALLPRKVWTECVYCPKFQGCTEVAVIVEVGASLAPLRLDAQPVAER